MQTLFRSKLSALALAVALVALPVVAQAQTATLSNTTLNGAITATQTTLVLGSASASAGSSFGAPAVGQCLFVDSELMRITAIASTTATVQRGNPAAPHATSAVIFTGACAGGNFQQAEPILGNAAVCNNQPAPWINVRTGNVWYCNRAALTWSGTNFAKFTYNSVPVAQ